MAYMYLHTNGELISKPHGDPVDFRESDLVRAFWQIIPDDRSTAWRCVVEAHALGANAPRLNELIAKWKTDDEDAVHYANFLDIILERDGNQWCAKKKDFVDLATSKSGFGPTALEAFSDLIKALGYQASKMWGPTIETLTKA